MAVSGPFRAGLNLLEDVCFRLRFQTVDRLVLIQFMRFPARIQVKNKQLRRLALGAEIVSAIAVIVTLIFLIFGMKENTNALQAQTYQELMRDVNNWRSSIREKERDQTLSKFRLDGFDSLPKGEQDLVRIIFLELWGIYEAAYFANERGVLGADEWARFENVICKEHRGQSAIFWDGEYEGLLAFRQILTSMFVMYVENQCSRQ